MSPLIPLTGAWLLGLWCAPLTDIAHYRWIGVAGGVCAGLAMLKATPGPRAVARVRRCLCVLAGCAGLGRSTAPAHPRVEELPAGWCLVDGYVEHSQRRTSGAFVQRLRVLRGRVRETGAALPAGASLLVGPFPMPEGTHVHALLALTPIAPFRNPSPHPPWPTPDPVRGRGRLPDAGAFRVLSRPLLPSVLGEVRSEVRSALYRTLSPVHGGLAAALLLGDRFAIDRSRRDHISQAGLAHLLAVSGLHVTLIAGLLVGALRHAGLLCRPLAARWEVGRIAHGVGVPLALALGSLCGGAPGARRAALTIAIGWSLYASGYRARASATAALSVLLLSALQPDLGRDAGFLLSTLATAALLRTTYPDPPSCSRAPNALQRWLRQQLVATLATTLATLPIVIWCFGQLPVAGLVANLVAVPVFCHGLLPLCLLHALVAVALPPLSACSAALLRGAADLFLQLLPLFGSLFSPLQVPPPSRMQGVILVLAAGALLLLRHRRHRILVALGSLIAAAGSEVALRWQAQPTHHLRITFVDVGQGDSALLDLPDGSLMLIDAGGDPWGARDPGRDALLPLLRARRRSHIDVAVLTHPHPDHVAGLDALSGTVTIGEIWDSGQARQERGVTEASRTMSERLDGWEAAGTRVRDASTLCGQRNDVGGAMVQVLWPCPGADPTLSENDNSLSLLIRWTHFTAFFTGDMELAAERTLLARTSLPQVDVLKVGHHGSRTSSSAAWLDRLQPRIAVISRGLHNRFGHPHPEVLRRLRRVGARVVDLATTGGTIVTFGQRELAVHTWSGWRLRLPVRGGAFAAPSVGPTPAAKHSVERSP